MRFNTTVLLFAPGIGMAGYLTAGWAGLGWAICIWAALTVIGTATFAAHTLVDRANANSHKSRAHDRLFPAAGAKDCDSPLPR
jgi:hypothetical protein